MTYPKRSFPVIPFIFAIGALLLCLIWFARPKNVTVTRTEAVIDPLEDTNVRVIINGTDRTEDLKEQRATPYRYRSPKTLKLSDINYITTRNKNPVLVFIDGSQLEVSDYVRETLPGEIQVRIDYEGHRQ